MEKFSADDEILLKCLHVLIGALFVVPDWLDTRYAAASDLQQLKESFEQSQLESRQFSVQQQIFSISSRYNDTNKMTNKDKLDYQQLSDLLKRINDRLEVLDKKLGLCAGCK